MKLTKGPRSDWFAMLYVFASFAVFCLLPLFMTGCTAFRVPALLNPVGWFQSDPLKKVEKAEKEVFDSKVGLAQFAQGLLAATVLELQSDPNPSAFTRRGLDYSRRASENMAQALGPLAPDAMRKVETLVQQRQSDNQGEKSAGDAALAAVDKQSSKLATRLAKNTQEVLLARQATAKAYERAHVAEEQRDTLIFWVLVGFAIYVVFAWILPLVGNAVPQLAGLQKLAALFAHRRAGST